MSVCEEITSEDWASYVEHCEGIERSYQATDEYMGQNIDPIVIRVNDEDSRDSDDDNFHIKDNVDSIHLEGH